MSEPRTPSTTWKRVLLLVAIVFAALWTLTLIRWAADIAGDVGAIMPFLPAW